MKRTLGLPKSNGKKHCSSDSESGQTETDSSQKNTLSVYCRVRPLKNQNEESYVSVVPPNIIKVSAVDSNRDGNYKETQYIFRGVFNENTTQDEIFKHTSLDLVKHLIKGRNSLLFAYGITGSGKTYTMNGTSDNIGIMPRCVEMLFNTIDKYQTMKYVFKPDKMNGFEVQCELDAMTERQKDLILCSSRTPSKFRKKEPESDMISKQRSGQSSYSNLVKGIDDFAKGNSFSVFITYVEIYNNAVYDLIEESDDVLRQRPPQPKLVREDGSHNMYVHGVTEVEVKTSEEAYELYFKGQRKRRLAGTALNSESSRSHSIFTIRLVQAPLHAYGDSPLDRNLLMISQLSLVDLAGSERTSRTKTVGQRLREAGLINNSLMTLRTCLEILRENQVNGTNKLVPYRESRLTHLFKNYFDGNGDIRMIVCISPGVDDYEETLHVLKFSEMSQEVLVNRAPPVKTNQFATPSVFATPNKRRNNLRPTTPRTDIETTPKVAAVNKHFVSSFDWGSFFTPKFPLPNEPVHHKNLVSIIEMRMLKEKESTETFHKIACRLRANLLDLESAATSNNYELKRVSQQLQDKNAKCLELDRQIGDLQAKLMSSAKSVKTLEEEMAEKDFQLNKEQREVLKERNRFKNKLAHNKERFTKEMEAKLQRQKSVLEFEILERDRKMQRVRRALGTPSCSGATSIAPAPLKVGSSLNHKWLRSNSDSSTTPLSSASASGKPSTPRYQQSQISSVPTTNAVPVIGSLDLATPSSVRASRSHYQATPISNPRHRRSRSAGGGEHWLDHKPHTAIPLNTILQPTIKHRKSVTKLTDVRDVANSKTSKYCLTTQMLDSDGDLETLLYKGDVVPTAGGGAQVTFNDLEVLHHKSPQSSPVKGIMKSPKIVTVNNEAVTASSSKATIEDRCAVSLEGHSEKRRI